MAFDVVIMDSASRDLDDIDRYISAHDLPGKAEAVVARIEVAIASLSESLHRGAYLPEEASFGQRRHREIFFKPYRIIYEVRANRVFVKVISDGRRNMHEILRRRLHTR